MEDRTFLTNNHSTENISDTFREYIELLVEEVVINGESFEVQKKRLRKYSEAAGLNYETIESTLSDLFDAIKELEEHESKSAERFARNLAQNFFFSETEVDKLVDYAAAVRGQKEAARKAQEEKERQAREEAKRKAREEAERRAREKAKMKAKEEAERKAREDRERKAKEEEERRRRERERQEAEEREKERLEAERKAKEEAQKKAKEEAEKETSFDEGVFHYYIIDYHDNGKNEVEVSYSGDKQFCPKEIIIPTTVVHNGVIYTVSVISTYGFSELSNLRSVTIPNTIEEIYHFAFNKCKSLQTVKMGDSIKSIGDSAFDSCENIKSISIPDSVESIGAWAFSGTGLRELTIPKSVRFIGEGAFAYCKKLRHYKVENPNCKIEQQAFANWNFFERLFV